ncbi:MAG: hypothetical protein N3D78_02670 [Candidatus Aenigmarchaeota archaeon]|nr:hypothetical protein [Candidatus Aenigmarchaeota archaeon]
MEYGDKDEERQGRLIEKEEVKYLEEIFCSDIYVRELYGLGRSFVSQESLDKKPEPNISGEVTAYEISEMVLEHLEKYGSGALIIVDGVSDKPVYYADLLISLLGMEGIYCIKLPGHIVESWRDIRSKVGKKPVAVSVIFYECSGLERVIRNRRIVEYIKNYKPTSVLYIMENLDVERMKELLEDYKSGKKITVQSEDEFMIYKLIQAAAECGIPMEFKDFKVTKINPDD